MFTTKVIKSHLKVHVKFDAQRVNYPIRWIEIYPVARENDHSLLPVESVNRLSNNWVLTSEIPTRFHTWHQLFKRWGREGGGGEGGDSAIHRCTCPVPERPISTNPGLKVCSFLVFYLPVYCLGKHYVSLLYLGAKAQPYFVSSSCMFDRRQENLD